MIVPDSSLLISTLQEVCEGKNAEAQTKSNLTLILHLTTIAVQVMSPHLVFSSKTCGL